MDSVIQLLCSMHSAWIKHSYAITVPVLNIMEPTIEVYGNISKSTNFTCDIVYIEKYHTMDLLWDKFQWILPLYMKPISFQSNASVVFSVTAAIFIDFCLKKPNVFSQHVGKNNNWISEFRRKNPQELKCWSTFCVNYFLRYYLMMRHQPIVKRVNGTHEWAHMPYQLLSAPCHFCLYKHRRQDGRLPLQSSWPVPIGT